jgi:hypothetical protein
VGLVCAFLAKVDAANRGRNSVLPILSLGIHAALAMGGVVALLLNK